MDYALGKIVTYFFFLVDLSIHLGPYPYLSELLDLQIINV
jgi:hypothetical protein